MRKFMPTTFKTFIICSIALAGVFPTAGFWSKDEILVGTGGLGWAAAMPTATTPHADHGADRRAHDRRLHDPGDLSHLLRRVPGPRPSPRVGPRITVPLIILSVFALGAASSTFRPGSSAAMRTIPPSGRNVSVTSSSRRPPTSRRSATRCPAGGSQSLRALSASRPGRCLLVLLHQGRRSRQGNRRSLTELPNGLTTTNRSLQAGHASSSTSTTSIISTTTSSSLRSRARSRRPPTGSTRTCSTSRRHRRETAVRAGNSSTTRSTRGHRGAVNGSGFLSNQSGQRLRRCRPARSSNMQPFCSPVPRSSPASSSSSFRNQGNTTWNSSENGDSRGDLPAARRESR